MQPIHPVCHETINPLVGRRVCAVTHDGTHYYGTINEVNEGRVLLSQCTIGNQAVNVAAAKTGEKSKSKYSKNKAKVSGFFGDFGGYGGFGYGYGFGSYWLPFALIASLFLLPFFFF